MKDKRRQHRPEDLLVMAVFVGAMIVVGGVFVLKVLL